MGHQYCAIRCGRVLWTCRGREGPRPLSVDSALQRFTPAQVFVAVVRWLNPLRCAGAAAPAAAAARRMFGSDAVRDAGAPERNARRDTDAATVGRNAGVATDVRHPVDVLGTDQVLQRPSSIPPSSLESTSCMQQHILPAQPLKHILQVPKMRVP